jgi:hypothetical protein
LVGGFFAGKIMVKELIIYEYTDEVETFITQRSFDELKSDNVYIIALQPDAQAYLRRRGIPYYNTVRFFSKKSHQDLVLKSAEIIEPFRRLLNIRDGLGIKEGYNNVFIFYLRHYSILYLLWLIEIVNNAIEQLKPDKIIAVRWDYSPDAMDCVPRNERYLSIIVEKVAVQKGLKVELFAGKKRHCNPVVKEFKLSFSKIMKTIVFAINKAIFRFKSKGKKIFLCSLTSYNLETVIESIVSKFNGLISVLLYSSHKMKDLRRMITDEKYWNLLSCLAADLPNSKRNVFLKDLNETIIRLKGHFLENRHILRYKNVEFQELVFLKIKKSMIPFLINLFGQTYNLDKFIRNKRPALVLSETSRGISYNLGELASFHSIISVLIQQGSHVPVSNRYADIEWGEHGLGSMKTHYKYLAIQSPWALNYLRNKPSDSIPIITGPLLFARISRDEDLKSSTKRKLIPQHYNKIIILHAGTPKSGRALRPYVYETVDEYIENINSLIKAVDKLKEVHLIVRFRPSDYLQLNDFLELLIKSNCYSVHSKGAFDDYLTISDLLVSYSSTTIEEALQNMVPVLLYDSQGKYCHIEGQALDPSLNPRVDSCYYVDAEGKLSWALRWLLENHFQKELPDSIWERHVFRDSEKVKLAECFGELFQDSKEVGLDS